MKATALTATDPTAAIRKSRAAPSSVQAGRCRAAHCDARTAPSKARMNVNGTRATAECRNVPYGTCTAKINPDAAKRIAAYAKEGPKSTDRRRAQAPIATNGASTIGVAMTK